MILDIVNAILALSFCALVLAFKIPLTILSYSASFLIKNERVPPSLYQSLSATIIKTSQLYLPLWLLRRLFKLASILISRKRWAKKLDGNNEQDGWEGYLIADGVEHTEVGKDVDFIVLYAHGGGFVCGDALGSLEMFVDWIEAWKLRYGANTQILSLEYKLSPESSFPVARDNMLACYNWLVTEKKISPSKIVFAGDSAGGNLTVVSALHLINQPYVFSIDPPAALILISPSLSAVSDARSFTNNAPYDNISPTWFNSCRDAYIGDSNLLPSCPMISPVFESQVSGLPKVWACAGEYEMFLDDITSFIEKLLQNDVKAELVVEDANFHDFAAFRPLSRNGAYGRTVENIGKFLYGERELVAED